MTEGPWDGSDLPPEAVHPTPPRGGGGGGTVPEPEHEPMLDARDKGAEGLLAHWPWAGIKPGLGGWDL